MEGSATFDKTRTYRYDLWRHWDMAKPGICWVMLNPSTADEHKLDPTITRCLKYSQAWGYGWLSVANLFAYRSTDPDAMFAKHAEGFDIRGPRNRSHVAKQMAAADAVVFAWGGKAKKFKDVIAQTGLDAGKAGKSPMALKVNGDGSPAHPLYLRGDLVPFLY
jgi:hypothetical protein